MSTLVPALDTVTSLAQAPQPASDVPSAHVVQFYKERQQLIDSLTGLVGPALSHGDAAIVVATKELREGLAKRLNQRRLDVTKATREGRYVSREARESRTCLALRKTRRTKPVRFHVLDERSLS